MAVPELAAPPVERELERSLRHHRVLPVVTMDDARDAERLAGALIEGGLPCAEITLRTPAAIEAIRRISDLFPEVLVGAGTVLTPAQADEARAAGARFVLSPGFNPAVIEHCLAHDLPVYPGVCTPSEIEWALAHGLSTLKFFPAEAAGGVAFLRALVAPYPMARFIPTGGITVRNLGFYLALPNVLACGGSWMVPPEWIAYGQFDRVIAEVANTVAVVDFHREGQR